MSYRCQSCTDPVPAGTPRLLHLVKRRDGSIAREVPVCPACQAALTDGAELSALIALRQPSKPEQFKPIGDIPPTVV